MVKKFKLTAQLEPKPKPTPELAAELPVARVVLDTPVPHLAREFDYLVPAALAERAQPGVRVKVKFGSQDLAGFITERAAAASTQTTTLADLVPLRKVVSPEPVLTSEILQLARRVADYYGATVPDVLRFAIPPRHARAETIPASEAVPTSTRNPGDWLKAWTNLWRQYENGADLLDQIAQPQGPGAHKYIWTALPGLAAAPPPATVPYLPVWAAQIAALVAQNSSGGVLIVAPDSHDVDRIWEALTQAGVSAVRLVAEDGPEARYRTFLAIERGQARVVVGTRSAAFAPVADLRLLILWGDGDSSLVEQHTPQFDAREVLALRSELAQVPLLVGSVGRTVAAQNWVATGQSDSIVGFRDTIRQRAPLIRVVDSAATADEGYLARFPHLAAQGVRAALAQGPVLVQVPLTGYLPRFECRNCRTPARCANCGGALALPDDGATPSCRDCGQLAPGWRCPNCGSTHIRAGQIGAERTAVELGRTFPGVQIIVSTANAPGGVKASLPRPTKPALVIATPGAEPVMPGGYATAVILDAGATTARTSLNVATDALRRWLAVAHLVVPATAGGQVFLVGDADPNATAGLVRLAPVWLAQRELSERTAAGLPPATRMAEITGDSAAVAALLSRIPLATPDNVLGPVPWEPIASATSSEAKSHDETLALFSEPQVKALIRVPQAQGLQLAEEIRAALGIRSAKREAGSLKATLDPADFT